MAYSALPVTREQAAANKRAFEPHSRIFTGVGIAGLAMILGVLSVFDALTVNAWLLLAIGVAAATAGFGGRHDALSRFRYRITFGRLRIAAVWTCALVFTVLVVRSPTPAPTGWPARAAVTVGTIAVLAWFLALVDATTLFDGDCEGVRFKQRGWQLRRTRVPWRAISQLVFATGTRPGTIELGVRARSDDAPKPFSPRPGEVLTDLPYRIVVPLRSLDIAGMRWLLNQSGRGDIALVERTNAGDRVLGYANSWPRDQRVQR